VTKKKSHNVIATKRKAGRPRGARNKPKPAPPPLARTGFRIREFCEMKGISRSAVNQAIKRGEIKTENIGRCVIILP
jgi:hypothetical protein